MMWLISFLTKRPTDKTIRITNIVFWILYISLLASSFYYSNWTLENEIFFWLINIPTNFIKYLEITLIIPWIFPILMWAFDLPLLKKKYLKITQVLFWIFIFYVASIISLPISSFLTQAELIGLIWIFPIFNGITWKFITVKWNKYKEVITKIRI